MIDIELRHSLDEELDDEEYGLMKYPGLQGRVGVARSFTLTPSRVDKGDVDERKQVIRKSQTCNIKKEYLLIFVNNFLFVERNYLSIPASAPPLREPHRRENTPTS